MGHWAGTGRETLCCLEGGEPNGPQGPNGRCPAWPTLSECQGGPSSKKTPPGHLSGSPESQSWPLGAATDHWEAGTSGGSGEADGTVTQ